MKRILALFLIVTLVSCENSTDQKNKEQNNPEENQDTLKQSTNDSVALKSFKNEIEFAQFCATKIQSGKANDLKPYTENGILFSPYAFIDTSSARVVRLDELSNPNEQMHYWGVYLGRGDSILLTTADYLNQFIFNFDLNKDNIEIRSYADNPKSRGSEMQNINSLYPNAVSVEFYKPASKKGYMDWSALIFVVHKKGDRFYLKAIAHNQWTP